MLHCYFSSYHPFLGLNSWNKWAYAAAVLGVIINFGFLIALLIQIRLGRKALQEAKSATDLSLKAVKETAHTRIDSQAPRVSAFLENPLVLGLKINGGFELRADPDFILPKMNDNALYFIVTGTFINEGKSTARIHMNSYAEFLPADPKDDPMFINPLQPSTEEYLLKPGKEVRFAWCDNHTLKEWAEAYTSPEPPNPLGACFMEVIVTDTFAEGVIDHIFLEMSGRPIEPIAEESGHWKLSKTGSIVALAYPIVRVYRHEGQKDLVPPWLNTYKG